MKRITYQLFTIMIGTLILANWYAGRPAAAQIAGATVINFEEPGLAPGVVTSIIKDGVTVSFTSRSSIFRPAGATISAPQALINSGNGDEVGFTVPMLFRFSRLQRYVRVYAGLNEAETNRQEVQATLTAYDSGGRVIDSHRSSLGIGPTPINTPLTVFSDAGDLIERVELRYSSNNAEVIDNLNFGATGVTEVPPDTTAPVVIINTPTEGRQVNCRTVSVVGRIRETNGVSLTINGAPVSVSRVDANNHEFSTRITLPEGSGRIEAVATDDSGNRGPASRTVDVRVPARFAVSDVRFTQTGLLDADVPMPTRRVSGKTGLFRVRLSVLTADGRPTWVDGASVVVSGSGVDYFARGERPGPGGAFGATALRDGENAYFFIPGDWLRGSFSYDFRLRISSCGGVAYETALASGLTFRALPPMTMLLAPQQNTFDAAHTRSLLRVLEHFARIYPVADGVAGLTSEDRGGIRFAMIAPINYAGHTDPNDGFLPSGISYDQGFLLRNHATGMSPGDDGRFGTTDDPFPSTIRAGEYLPINFSSAEDADRNGRFDAEELDRVFRGADGMRRSEALQRFSNWVNFMNSAAETRRQSWNRACASARAARVINMLTWGAALQNNGDPTGQAGRGHRAFWASLDDSGPDGDVNAVIAHETGHALGFGHADAGAPTCNSNGACNLAGEAINLLTREVITAPLSVMCSCIGGPRPYFLTISEYNQLFDRFVTGEELRTGLMAEGDSGGAAFATSLQLDQAAADEQTFVFVGTISRDGEVTVADSYLAPADMPLTEAAEDKTYTVAFINQSGQQLAEQPIHVSFEQDDAPFQSLKTVFSFVSRFPQETAFVELRQAGKVLTRLTRSASAPNIQGVTASPAKDPKSGEFIIEWQGGDPDGDPLSFSVLYSVDSGMTYIPLVSGWRENKYSLPAAALAGGGGGLFKVIASDGFNTAEAVSPLVSLPVAPPVAAILSPENGAALEAGAAVTLRGAALDPEEGLLGGESLQWFLVGASGEQLLGSGRELFLQALPAGKHTIRLVATDRDGLRGVDEITIRAQQAPSTKSAVK
ncbi:MAG TPA: hypothetical protein VJ810_40600 [Blastocatellia bacterium]|nr:hypothetical protein [Blastocatellia bacterium]